MKTALIIYWLKSGNTEKVANASKEGFEEANVQITVRK